LFLGQSGALGDALFLLSRRGSALLFDGLHAALQVSKKPVDALERCFRTAPALFESGKLGR
jgi:hypothetical protein